MSMEQEEGRVAIAVLALDIVSFSTQFDEQQVRLVQVLTHLAREALNGIEQPTYLLPTGDGLIIALPGKGSTATLEVALRIHDLISRKLLRLPIRMGLHEGEGRLLQDINDRTNVAGNVMNLCQRVMDVGDDGHILVSESSFLTLKNTRQYGRNLTPLSTNPVEVKHGVKLNLYSYYDKDVGNSATPTKIKSDIGLISSSIGRPPLWAPFLETNDKLKIISHCTRLVASPDFVEALELAIVQRGTQVQILLLNSLSSAFGLRANSRAYKSQDELLATFEYVYRSLYAFPATLPEERHRLFDVRLFDAVPTFVAFITDHRAYLSFYLENALGSKGPFFSCRRQEGVRGLYHVAEEAFDQIWHSRSISIFDSDLPSRQQSLIDRQRLELGTLQVPDYQSRK